MAVRGKPAVADRTPIIQKLNVGKKELSELSALLAEQNKIWRKTKEDT